MADEKPDDVVGTHDVTRQERDDLQVAITEGILTYRRLVDTCADVEALKEHKAIWSAQVERFQALLKKFK